MYFHEDQEVVNSYSIFSCSMFLLLTQTAHLLLQSVMQTLASTGQFLAEAVHPCTSLCISWPREHTVVYYCWWDEMLTFFYRILFIYLFIFLSKKVRVLL